jgi:hypothetical protein
VENSRLRQENEVLATKTFVANAVEVERLHREVMLKDAEADKLRSDVKLLKVSYDRNIDHYVKENEGLRNQLQTMQQ